MQSFSVLSCAFTSTLAFYIRSQPYTALHIAVNWIYCTNRCHSRNHNLRIALLLFGMVIWWRYICKLFTRNKSRSVMEMDLEFKKENLANYCDWPFQLFFSFFRNMLYSNNQRPIVFDHKLWVWGDILKHNGNVHLMIQKSINMKHNLTGLTRKSIFVFNLPNSF